MDVLWALVAGSPLEPRLARSDTYSRLRGALSPLRLLLLLSVPKTWMPRGLSTPTTPNRLLHHSFSYQLPVTVAKRSAAR
ncbi:hypothetical protein BDN71DRAFT_1443208 [Pleurotus eryngii]|uniref:Uncharacterized protein n=1 Tax=Pleurotus eryngii TaxID=5323 RepID=A0A9P6A3S6_PLEER|nr:hypothetical protein BDN71DRAFT_1443208 [Pleurotus eryngii]